MEKRYVIVSGQVCDYEEKAPFIPSGKSVQGALEYRQSDDKLKCHECGKWATGLGWHAARAHGISSPEYRLKHGLNMTTSLLSPLRCSVRQKRARDRYRNPIQASVLAAASRKGLALAKGRPRVARPQYERRNYEGRCQAQLLLRIKTIAADIGYTPSEVEMAASGISGLSVFGSGHTRILQQLAGLEPNEPCIHNKDTDKYSKKILIELLRDFYVLNRRLPMDVDLKSGLLPAHATFKRYFGTFADACQEAGFTYRLGHQGRKILVDTNQAADSHAAVA